MKGKQKTSKSGKLFSPGGYRYGNCIVDGAEFALEPDASKLKKKCAPEIEVIIISAIQLA